MPVEHVFYELCYMSEWVIPASPDFNWKPKSRYFVQLLIWVVEVGATSQRPTSSAIPPAPVDWNSKELHASWEIQPVHCVLDQMRSDQMDNPEARHLVPNRLSDSTLYVYSRRESLSGVAQLQASLFLRLWSKIKFSCLNSQSCTFSLLNWLF